jgi:hypothetical protein
LNPSIALTAGRTGKWSKYEDIKLKHAVQMHGGENSVAFAALVPGRTRIQCHTRWQSTLDPSIDRTPLGRSGTWTEDEGIKLKDAVRIHGGKDWAAITAMVPGQRKLSVGADVMMT